MKWPWVEKMDRHTCEMDTEVGLKPPGTVPRRRKNGSSHPAEEFYKQGKEIRIELVFHFVLHDRERME